MFLHQLEVLRQVDSLGEAQEAAAGGGGRRRLFLKVGYKIKKYK